MALHVENNIIQILKGIPIFRNFTDKEFGDILLLLQPISYPAGKIIIREGAKGDSMFIVIAGTVKISKTVQEDEEILIDHLSSGAYFGDFSLIDNMLRSANVTATSDTETLKLLKVDFDNLLAANIDISNKFYKNCLEHTFARFRNIISNYTSSQHMLNIKSSALDEINRDLSSARKIQRYFINTDLLDNNIGMMHNVNVSYIYNPSIDIGGDYLNILDLGNDRIGIMIADFLGHGITAALGTGVLRSALSIYISEHGNDPVSLLKLLNNHFLDVIPKLYATCYYSIIDLNQKKIILSKAGHPHPLIWKYAANDFLEFDCIGTGMGFIKEAKFGFLEFSCGPGDKILFFTDGVIEQHNGSGELYSIERLRDVFKNMVLNGEGDIVKKINQDIHDFAQDEHLEDDITMLLLELK